MHVYKNLSGKVVEEIQLQLACVYLLYDSLS